MHIWNWKWNCGKYRFLPVSVSSSSFISSSSSDPSTSLPSECRRRRSFFNTCHVTDSITTDRLPRCWRSAKFFQIFVIVRKVAGRGKTEIRQKTLLSLWTIVRVQSVHSMTADWAPSDRQRSDKANWFGPWVRHHIHRPSPFIVITQPKSWHWFYRPS